MIRFLRTHLGIILFILLCTLSIISINFSNANRSLRYPSLNFLMTIQNAASKIFIFISDTFRSVRELGTLRNQYENLLAQTQNYHIMENDIMLLSEEVQRLRQLLGFSQQIQHNVIAAEVVSKDQGIFFSSFTIDKGWYDGIEVGLPVIAIQDEQQALVGKTTRVGRRYSIIAPIFDTGSFVAARITRSRLEGLIEGSGSALRPLTMKYIDARGKNIIEYGDTVQTSGLGSVYPPNIPIGEVRGISARSYELTLEIEVEPYINFSQLEYIFIIDTNTVVPREQENGIENEEERTEEATTQ